MTSVKKIIFVLLVIFFLSSLTKNLFSYQRSLVFFNSYQDQYEKEQKKNNELKTQLVKTADQYEIEKTIRNQLNMTKDNETMILLPELSPTPFIPTPTQAPVYRQWWDTFFQKNWALKLYIYAFWLPLPFIFWYNNFTCGVVYGCTGGS